jgi:hypothetical protein
LKWFLSFFPWLKRPFRTLSRDGIKRNVEGHLACHALNYFDFKVLNAQAGFSNAGSFYRSEPEGMHFLRVSTHLRRDEPRTGTKSLGRQYDLVPIRTDSQLPMNYFRKEQMENEQR